MSGLVSTGTRRKTRIASPRKYTPAFRSTARTEINTNDRKTQLRMLSFFPAPYRTDTAAPLPMHSPERIDVRKVMSAYAEPTAPRASVPI